MKDKKIALQAVVTFVTLLSFGITVLRLIAEINQTDLVRLLTAVMIGFFILLLYLVALEYVRR